MAVTLAELEVGELGERVASWGFKPSHAARVLRRFYAGEPWTGAPGHALPAGLLERLSTDLVETSATVVQRQQSEDGTTKLLLRLADGHTVETVLLPDFRPDRAAGCLSSQVGCAMGCDFCATTRTGWERNLTSGEIVEQFLALRREARRVGRTLKTVVFMGMGEPMLNLDAVLPAIRRMADNALGGLGWRQITVSTVGIVPGIDALAASGLPVQLAVSLHAPDDVTRARLLPMGRRHSIAEILAAVRRYHASRERPIIIQYCLLAGVNDSVEQARQLAALLETYPVHVNLLRYNATGVGLRGTEYAPASAAVTLEFARILQERGLVVHVRRSRGPDIDAACGQLRYREGEQEAGAERYFAGA